MDTLQRGIISLLRSGITGEQLTLPEDFSLEEALPVLKNHSVAPLAYQGAANCRMDSRQPAMQRLFAHYYQVLLHHEKQAGALNALLAAFQENGIDHMPLKGCNIKKLYPKPELRLMADADILIRLADYHRIRPIMEAQGFHLNADNVHVYEWRSKYLNVELHKTLSSPVDRDYHAYYGTGWRLALRGEKGRHDLSREDAYIFALVHFAKHYRGSGIGCRHLVDLYVYRRAWPDLDLDYVNRELEILHLAQFHGHLMRTIRVWFEDAVPDTVTEMITAFIFSSGNWGTVESGLYMLQVKKAARDGAVRHEKGKSLLRALFPPMETMAYNHKCLHRFPFLLPLFWLLRGIRLVLFTPGKIIRKLRIIKNVNDDKVLTYQESLEMVGLGYHFE